MKKIREGNFDLLRIICAIAVISIHVSATYIGAITNEETFGELYLNGIMTSCIYNSLSRFAVPCFVVLSGAFILTDKRNSEYKYFYRKTFKNIGIPTFIFSVLYFVYSFLKAILAITFKGREMTMLLQPIKNVIKGAPFGHMWYLYMVLGIYLLVPVIFLFKNQVGEKIFNKVSWIFVILASLSCWTSSHKLNWDIGLSFEYVGYFMIGYELRRLFYEKKNNKKGYALIVGGILTELLVSFLRYNQVMDGIADDELKYELLTPLSPLVVIASILIFAGVSCLEVKKDFSKLSALTFLIYLFHAGYWDLLSKLIFKIGFEWDNRVVIPVCIVLVFIISSVSARVYLKAWKWIEGKWQISDKICRMIKLQ